MHRNLGGLGPDLDDSGSVDEADASRLRLCTRNGGRCPPEIYYRNVGTAPDRHGIVTGVDLAVRNISHYHAPSANSPRATRDDFGVLYVARCVCTGPACEHTPEPHKQDCACVLRCGVRPPPISYCCVTPFRSYFA